MVKPATALGRSGLHDWLIQRISAIVLAVYVVFIFGFLMTHPIDFLSWRGLFDYKSFKVFSLLAIVALTAHAWVGMWTVFTDYVKPTGLRLVLQSALMLTCLCIVLWGVSILWGV